jgi:hypothetical protein
VFLFYHQSKKVRYNTVYSTVHVGGRFELLLLYYIRALYTILYRSQYSALCYARAAEGGAGEEERRRDEGTGEGAKEVALAAAGKAAGAWVMGG